MFEGPVSRDWKKTETGPDQDRSRPEILKTDQDRNRSPVFGLSPFSKIKDHGKTGLSGLNRFFQPQNPVGHGVEYLCFVSPNYYFHTLIFD